MTRQLLDGATGAPPPLPGTPPVLPLAVPAAAELPPAPEQQALAGALPAWDLLPATGFVRRKR
ncbi:hypothetical protein C1924_19760 [Stenotrophomonas sp. ESTM1D_MKCIP4_1]|uniref:hypothetical protein n=1 Tax=Stenotrophomonas sp. ESTM1D_MKCIP4_1 TaxID=2072414 RepID=UPI000D53D847|nr:hypothetical protein [Stenotrophomonas sp. ESTM1D_MKCIP4_1]AWH55270.1 hypothetical protein C1924_19760 [Stenotrophomonas sp. ESTM1D_MKCIP4_1]